MRLIDADNLIKLTQKDMEFAFNNGFLDMAFEREHLIKVIRNQPTAYDIDKVVNELENELGKGNIAIDFGEFRLFEIIKQGGVSDDVCEWRMTDTKKLMPYKTSCGNEDLYDNSYKYCPYCSKKIKKIKVVE